MNRGPVADVARQQRVVERLVGAGHGLQAKRCFGPQPPGLTLAPATGRVVHVADQRLRHGGRVGRRHQRARHARLHQFAVAADVGRQHRQSAGHGLQDGVGNALGERGQHEQIQPAQQRGHIVAAAGQPHHGLHIALFEHLFDRPPQLPVAHQHQAQAVLQVRSLLQRLHESPRQGELVLDRFEAPHRADQKVPTGLERPGVDTMLAIRRRKAGGVDAVVNLGDALPRHAHRAGEIVRDMLRQRDVVLHKRAHQPPPAAVARGLAGRVVHVPAVLAVHACGHAGGPGHGLHFERGDVARVHQRRAQAAQQPPQRRVRRQPEPGRLVQRVEVDIVAAQAPLEAGQAGQTDHGVAIPLRGQTVQQVQQAVLQTAHLEAVHDVHQQRRRIGPLTTTWCDHGAAACR